MSLTNYSVSLRSKNLVNAIASMKEAAKRNGEDKILKALLPLQGSGRYAWKSTRYLYSELPYIMRVSINQCTLEFSSMFRDIVQFWLTSTMTSWPIDRRWALPVYSSKILYFLPFLSTCPCWPHEPMLLCYLKYELRTHDRLTNDLHITSGSNIVKFAIC